MSTDLFNSAYSNDIESLQKALAAGADPNQPHPRAGTLPLQLACQGDAVEAIKVLLAAGAKADMVYSWTSRVDGRVFANHTPLMYVKSIEAAQLLLDAGGKLEQADERGWTVLVKAAHAGSVELTAFLLDRGADATVRPAFDGRRWSLGEFLEEMMWPTREETEAGRERLAALRAVRDLIKARAGI